MTSEEVKTFEICKRVFEKVDLIYENVMMEILELQTEKKTWWNDTKMHIFSNIVPHFY